MLEGVTSVLALLTALPVRQRGTLDSAAGALWAFPLAGILIGAIAGSIGMALLLVGLEPLIAAVGTVAALALLTGMHHLDGLADLADALMVRGSRSQRLAALKDHSTGTAGTACVALVLMGLVAAVHSIDAWSLIGAIITAEVAAKLAMVALMRSQEAAPESTSAAFVGSARRTWAFAAVVAISLVAVAGISGLAGVAAAGATIGVALVVGAAGTRGLGGLRGDTLGAANELARLAALIVLVGVP